MHLPRFSSPAQFLVHIFEGRAPDRAAKVDQVRIHTTEPRLELFLNLILREGLPDNSVKVLSEKLFQLGPLRLSEDHLVVDFRVIVTVADSELRLVG